MYFKSILATFTRRKVIDISFESPLRRCLKFWDLLLLGVGGSVDVALYVLLGNVIRDFCGPSIIISMIIGIILCCASGLCYAEFASYVPTSGSDYDYIYLTLGELCGFLDGWSILIGSIIATAALAQGAADMLRSLTNSATYDHLDAYVALPDFALFASNVNIVGAAIVILVTVITAIGVQSSVRINSAIVIINLLVILFAFILGLAYVNFENWSGWSKFAPFGIKGIFESLPFSIFFYGGFIQITFSTEEVIDPQKVLPRSIMAALLGIFACYFTIGFVLSTIVPYNQLSSVSPLPDALAKVSFKESKYIVAFGGFCSCFSSVLTATYANSRLAYVMARDGLLMNYLCVVNTHSLVPVRAILITGIAATFLAAFIDLTILIEICSILTILPYIILNIAVILLRYKEDVNDGEVVEMADNSEGLSNNEELNVPPLANGTMNGHHSLPQTNILCESKTKPRILIALLILLLSSACVSLLVRLSLSDLLDKPVFISLTVLCTIPLVISMLVIYKTPHQVIKFPFTMPMFPLLPVGSLVLCTIVMFQFSMWAWILFVINSAIGMAIYLGYGVKNSKVNPAIGKSTVMELTEDGSPHLLT